MGYKSDVRIITTKKGFDKLKKYIDEVIQLNEKTYTNLLDECIILGETKELKYFGWNDIKWYEDDYGPVKAVMDGLHHLRDYDFSYRYSRFGENYDDYNEFNYNSYKREKFEMPYICLKRNYDDELVLNNIKITEKMTRDIER